MLDGRDLIQTAEDRQGDARVDELAPPAMVAAGETISSLAAVGQPKPSAPCCANARQPPTALQRPRDGREPAGHVTVHDLEIPVQHAGSGRLSSPGAHKGPEVRLSCGT